MSIVKNLRSSNTLVDIDAVEKAINAGYEAQRREKKFTKKTTFAPSTIAYGHGTCARYWSYAFDGGMQVDENTAESIATMANGTAAGIRIANAFEKSGILVEAEREALIADPPIRGFIDVIVRLPGDDEDMVGEIKTTRAEMFTFRQNSGKPTAYHNYQLLIYLKATGLSRGFFVYENRNDQTMVLIPVTMNEKNEQIISNCFDWLRVVRKAWVDKTLPKRPKGWTIKNKNCRNCPFYAVCWETKEDNGVIVIPPMEVETP